MKNQNEEGHLPYYFALSYLLIALLLPVYITPVIRGVYLAPQICLLECFGKLCPCLLDIILLENKKNL